MFQSVLVANRGEIACRIIRTLRRLGIRSVAVHSDADVGAMHVREADASERIGESPAALSYLNPAAVVEAAMRAGAEAIHPGYGFLSESPKFAEAVRGAGLAWIGPPPAVLELTGDKMAARRAFEQSGFPVLPGAGPFTSTQEALDASSELGFPVMVKAVMGGGGIGMGVARDQTQLAKAVETASSRGTRFFADPSIYIERFVEEARHVEVQVLCGADGRGTHRYERECSVQRRHQKVLEETPSPAALDRVLPEMTGLAVRSMEAIGYVGAGTVECVISPDREFFFLEVNARIQVEHPVTEETCGIDLVEDQLRIAAGERLSTDRAPRRNGHAIECRVYAEDPRTFLPSPGLIERLHVPAKEFGVRVDFGYGSGDEVPMFYDPLVGKVVVSRPDRDRAVRDMRAFLDVVTIEGIKTNIPALKAALDSEAFRSGSYDTGLLGK